VKNYQKKSVGQNAAPTDYFKGKFINDVIV